MLFNKIGGDKQIKKKSKKKSNSKSKKKLSKNLTKKSNKFPKKSSLKSKSKKSKKSKNKKSVKFSFSLSQLKPFLKYCDDGLVSETQKQTDSVDIQTMFDIGEFFDIYCVANNKKPLAALDFSSRGINKLRKKNKKLINELIDYLNKNSIYYIQYKGKGTMYLNTIFFKKNNMNNAIKLMDVLWGNNRLFKGLNYHIAIGILLGYSDKNIIYFMKRNFEIIVSNKQLNDIKKKIKNYKLSFDDLKKYDKFEIYETIKNI